MAYTGCMDSVRRVKGKVGLVLGENRDDFKEFQNQE